MAQLEHRTNSIIAVHFLSITNKMQHYTLLFITTSGSSKQAWQIPDAVCTVLEVLTMGGKTARNMYSIDNIKEYCITSQLVGYT